MEIETKQLPRILVAEDRECMLEAISEFIKQRCEIVGLVKDGIAMVRETLRLRPDIALMDISMPGLNGLDATAELKKTNSSSTRIVILTSNQEPIILRAAFTAGAIGYVLKCRMVTDLMSAIEAALQDQSFISPPLADAALLPANTAA